MPLNADNLLDRNHLKSLLTRWRIIAIAAIVLGLILAIEHHDKEGISAFKGNHIARVMLDGIINDDTSLEELLDDLKDDDRVKAVIVRVDSPGGSAVGGEEIYLRLRALSKVKPVVAVMRTLATSAGYMVSLGADHIIARTGTITGSIGVIIQSAEVTKLADKLGIQPITIKSAPLKGSASPLEKMTPEAARMLQRVVDSFYESFIDMVVERRHLPEARVRALADGSIFTGTQALEYKLIDQIGGESEAIEWLSKEKGLSSELEVKDAKPKRDVPDWLESLSESVSHTVFGSFGGKTLDGLILIWQANTL